MLKVITAERLPIKLWIDDIEEGALEQAKNMANLPFAFRHVAIMPDCHQGYGMPIGGVLATEGVVIPNAVGVDIGCGMCALRTTLNEIKTDALKNVIRGIRKRIPLGFDHHKEDQDPSLMPDVKKIIRGGIVEQQYAAALRQLGTLGGGNHFIEIQKGSDGTIWIMVHSGSRNMGLQVAAHYNGLAAALNDRWRSDVPASWQLAFLPADTQEAQDYMDEMRYCVEFAFANRKLMMDNIRSAFREVLGDDFSETDFINIAHNYAQWEHHFNTDVLVHRKGATSAKEGEKGIIPGSQGTGSYIVRGRGNPESFMSCSHGAGRLLSRKKARNTLDLEQEKARLDKQNIIHSIRHKKDLDEAPGAYKDIEMVMECQKDLVDIVVELKPLAVIKG